MKLTRIKKHGAILLALIVLVIAVIVIGLAVYAIYKALSKWNPRPIQPDDVNQWVQNSTAEMEGTNLPISGELSDGTYFIQMTETNWPTVQVQRSTNLIDWETIAHLTQPELVSFVDTNPPWPSAFYRVRP